MVFDEHKGHPYVANAGVPPEYSFQYATIFLSAQVTGPQADRDSSRIG